MSNEQLFEDIVDDLKMLGVTAGTMFSARTATADGKVFAFFHGDSMSFRLGETTKPHARALALSGSELFDPSGGAHQPFKDWVRVTEGHSGEWSAFAVKALQHLREKL